MYTFVECCTPTSLRLITWPNDSQFSGIPAEQVFSQGDNESYQTSQNIASKKHNKDSTRLFVWSQRMALGAANTNFRMPKITYPDSLYDKSGHHNA